MGGWDAMAWPVGESDIGYLDEGSGCWNLFMPVSCTFRVLHMYLVADARR